MKYLNMLVLTSIVVFFTACGGGGGSSSPEVTDSTTVNTNGLWYGTQVIDGISYDVQYIAYDGEIQGYSAAGLTAFSGTYSISGNKLSTTYEIYPFTNTLLGTGTGSATVVENESVIGTFSNSYGQNGALNLQLNYL